MPRAKWLELVALGVAYLANPFPPEHLRTNASLNKADKAMFHGGGVKGYTDYPMLFNS